MASGKTCLHEFAFQGPRRVSDHWISRSLEISEISPEPFSRNYSSCSGWPGALHKSGPDRETSFPSLTMHSSEILYQDHALKRSRALRYRRHHKTSITLKRKENGREVDFRSYFFFPKNDSSSSRGPKPVEFLI
jgi:hypothetical protein